MKVIWWVISILFILLISVYAWRMAQQPAKNTDALNKTIIAVARANSVAEREVALTQALNYLAHIETEKHPTMGNGIFYLALGDIYRAFNALPWAMWSYKQAESLAPSHPGIPSRITSVRHDLQLQPIENASVFEQLLFFHHLSLPRRLQLFFLTAFLGFSFGSVAIWQNNKLWKYSATVFGCVAAVLLTSGLYTRYVEPAEAVVIQGTLLSSAPSSSAGTVGDLPLFAGSTALILSVEKDGQWLRVFTEQGIVGYIPSDHVRLIY